MKNKIIIFILMLSCFTSYAQYDWTPGTLILNNGDTLKGFIKIPKKIRGAVNIRKSKVQFKKTKKSKKEKYNKTQVNKIYFGSLNPNLGYYEYITLGVLEKNSFLKLIRNGKVKLYIRTVFVVGVSGFGDNYSSQKVKEYYILRKGEPFATHVFQNNNNKLSFIYNANLSSFNNSMKKYFSDCEKVVSYIEDELYSDFDITQIVEDYNLLCE